MLSLTSFSCYESIRLPRLYFNAKMGLAHLWSIFFPFRISFSFFARIDPANSFLFAGTVPANLFLFAGTVPANSFLFAGSVPANNLFHNI